MSEQEMLNQMSKYEAAIKHLVPIFSEAIDAVIDKGLTFPEPLPREVGAAAIVHAIVASGVIFGQEQEVPLPIVDFIFKEVFKSAIAVHNKITKEQEVARAAVEAAKPKVTLT